MKVLIFVLNCLASTVAWGAPTGDLWIPQARVLGANEFNLDMKMVFPPIKDRSTVGAGFSTWGANLGLLDTEGFHWEVGLDWTEPSRETVSSAVSFNTRVSFGDVFEKGWAFAVGIQDAGLESGINDFNIFYGVFQNRLGDRLLMEVGGYSGNEKALGTGRSLSGLILGAWAIVQKDLGRVGLEFMSGTNRYGYLMGGVKVGLREFVFVTAGYGLAQDRERQKDLALVRFTLEY